MKAWRVHSLEEDKSGYNWGTSVVHKPLIFLLPDNEEGFTSEPVPDKKSV